MEEKNWKKITIRTKKQYQMIGSVTCPAFTHEKICFNRYGWKHLFFKGRIPRDRKDIYTRLLLLPHVPKIIESSNQFNEYRIKCLKDNTSYFWSLHSTIKDKSIRVVIRQINTGNKHFFSVMNDTSNTKTPFGAL